MKSYSVLVCCLSMSVTSATWIVLQTLKEEAYPPSCFVRASSSNLNSHQHSQKYFYRPFLHILIHNSNAHLGIVMVLQQELDRHQACFAPELDGMHTAPDQNT